MPLEIRGAYADIDAQLLSASLTAIVQMRTEYWDKVSDIFKHAVELEGEEREAFLQEACAGDGSLREEVDSLLEADQEGPFTEKVLRAINVGLDEVVPNHQPVKES